MNLNWLKSLILLILVISGTSSYRAFSQENNKPNDENLSTKSKVILLPCRDGSASSFVISANKNFCTETYNLLVKDGSVRTISWFKVSSVLEEMESKDKSSESSNPFYTGMSTSSASDYTSDKYVRKLIKAGSLLGAKYIIRPVILSQNADQNRQLKMRTGFLGLGGPRHDTQKTAEVTIKLDIFSVKEEDLIGTQSFTGTSSKNRKGGGYDISNIYGTSDGMVNTAMKEAIYKSISYISNRIN